MSEAPKPGTVPDFVIQFHGMMTDLLAIDPDPAVRAALQVCIEYVTRHEPSDGQ